MWGSARFEIAWYPEVAKSEQGEMLAGVSCWFVSGIFRFPRYAIALAQRGGIMAQNTGLRREINLPASVFTIVGLVIGSSIWLLPTEALAKAGPGMFISYILAAIPCVFTAVVCAYVGSAVPVTGGAYVVTSRSVSPLAGFILLWCVVLAVASVAAFLAGTFAIYVNSIPGVALPAAVTGSALLLFAYLLNLLNVRVSSLVGMIATLCGDVAGICIFVFFGLPHINPSNYVDLFPKGFGPIATTAILFFFSYVGFAAILEVGGEIKNPRRNIPIALALSMSILIGLYTLQAFVLAGNISWTEAARQIETTGSLTVTQVAASFLPPSLMAVIPFMVLISIMSTIYPVFLAYSRDIMLGGKDRVFPEMLARVGKRFGTPVAALTVILGLSMAIYLLILFSGPALGIPLQRLVSLFAALTVGAVLVVQGFLCVAALKIRKNYPEWDKKAGFRPGNAALWFWAVGGILFSALFLLILGLDEFLILAVLLIWIITGVIYYFLRKQFLVADGVNIDELMTKWPQDIDV